MGNELYQDVERHHRRDLESFDPRVLLYWNGNMLLQFLTEYHVSARIPPVARSHIIELQFSEVGARKSILVLFV